MTYHRCDVPEHDEDHDLAGSYLDIGALLDSWDVAKYEDVGDDDDVEAPPEVRVAWLASDWRQAEADAERLRDVLRQVAEYAEVHPPSITAALAREALDARDRPTGATMDPNEDTTPCAECRHPMLAHRRDWCDVDDCECPGHRAR